MVPTEREMPMRNLVEPRSSMSQKKKLSKKPHRKPETKKTKRKAETSTEQSTCSRTKGLLGILLQINKLHI